MGSSDFDLPYEDSPYSELSVENHILASAVTILAGAADTAMGRMPVLVFRFIDGKTGEFITPITLVLPPERLQKIPELVRKCVVASIKESRNAR